MTQIEFPSGDVVDFEDANEQQIKDAVDGLRERNPELFAEKTFDYGTASFDEIVARARGEQSGLTGGDPSTSEPSFSPTIEGQVTDYNTRWEFGKKDTVEEEEKFLTEKYGPDSFGRDDSGNYFLKLDNISPEIKANNNLANSGTMWFNRPGGGFLGLFDAPDVVEFLGKYRGELIGATGAAMAASGLGLIPGSILIGLGAGLGKGADEYLETREGSQLQSADEIYGDVATAAAFNAGGNLLIGGVLKGLGRIIKGPGNPDAQVISDLMDQGLTAGQAKAAAVQLQRTSTREAMEEGLRPTILDATGKAVLGRMQAIHEGIFPNRAAARSNRKYVEDLLNKYRNGELSGDALGEALDQNAKNITNMLAQAMKDPDDAVRLANQHLRKVIDEEIALLKKLYTPGDETAAAFQNEVTRMVRLWQNNNKQLYGNASEALGENKLFKSSDLQAVVKRQLKQPLAEESGLKNNPVYKYILGKTDDYTLKELQTLRTAVNNSRSSSLVGDVGDFELKELADTLDNMFSAANKDVMERVSVVRSILNTSPNAVPQYRDLGPFVNIPQGKNPGMFLSRQEAEQTLKTLDDGFRLLKEADAHYAKGAESFKTGALNMLNRNVKDGYFADLNSVVETVVQNGKPELLKKYLKAVTPEESVRGTLQSVPETQWLLMADAAKKNNIEEINRLLQNNFPALAANFGDAKAKALRKIGLSFKPEKFLETLGPWDPYRNSVLNDLAETFTLHAADSAAAASGRLHKDVSRQMLAKSWMKTAWQKSNDMDVFDPVKFRRQFDDLGKEVQQELFGESEARRLNSVLKDFALVARDRVKGGLRFQNADTNTIINSNMRNIVSNLQDDVAEAQAQSTSALFQAIKSGRVDDADTLIQAAVKDPRLLDDLVSKVPDAVLNQPYGLRDAAMSRVIREAFPDGVTEEAVINGAWQNGMRAALENMNQRGSLNKILGPETVQDLLKLTKLPVGDRSLRGKGGLASSAYAAGIGMRILAEPVSGIASVASIYASGRILRSKRFLKLMTSPSIRATDLKAGIRALTDDILAKARADGVNLTRKQANDAAKKQLGNLSVFRRRLREIAGTEARVIGLTKASESLDPDTREGIRQNVSQAVDVARPMVQNLQQQLPEIPAAAAQAQQAVDPLRQAMREQMDPRVQARQDLVGGR